MTRYFYTDPLAAAWMAKHFGIKFEGSHFSISALSGQILAQGFTAELADKFYIHPDSLLDLEKIPDIKKAAMKELGLWPLE